MGKVYSVAPAFGVCLLEPLLSFKSKDLKSSCIALLPISSAPVNKAPGVSKLASCSVVIKAAWLVSIFTKALFKPTEE